MAFKSKGNKKGYQSDYLRTASTRTLNRILLCLEEANRRMTQTEINYVCCSSSNKVKDGLRWLVRNKILIKEKFHSTDFYKINPKWRELRDEQLG